MAETTTTKNEIPAEMKRLVVTSPGKGTSVADCTMEIETLPTPTPASGEVLVKVVAAPINPSDYGSWFYSKPEAYPMSIGKEGCGIVIVADEESSCPVGTKVGFVTDGKQGTFSEYLTLNAKTGVFKMPEDVPIEDCASFMVNPYTALGILDTAQRTCASSKAIIHTAAASQLGQMIVRLAPSKGLEIINIVRREEQKELLEKIGAKHVIVAASVDDHKVWKAELQSKVNELGAVCAFDAIAGDMAGHLMDVLPSKGIVHVYGGLAGPANGLSFIDLIYGQKELKGFFVTAWLKEGGPSRMIPRMMAAGKDVNAGLKGPDGWSCTQFCDTTMENAKEDLLELLAGKSTGKKLRIRLDNAV
eukprot:CAMPEP_0201666046 /NCGR_PEP_ID=MMETSP0494-20130426/7006_1 /ASSEMBLY_ACC=CAM_ASM_000839 /TAXON_ID=420259 /ORGANISM="Thalassiosira gravida, Strain GMp14c1" /LENGTH=359 /DNA_ID=CAMNT_0048145119 /DNA_START=72 /DNA_END=1151 /DNA_ORIENTATION=-